MFNLIRFTLLPLLLLSLSLHVVAKPLTISPAELAAVAEKIYRNETGGKVENLMVWNEGEDFPSLGIGHFIWYKKDAPAIFEESFPDLVTFLEEKGAELPYILKRHKHAPWPNRQHFLTNRNNPSGAQLQKFLYETRDLQILFIFERLQNALDKMMSVSNSPEEVRQQFYRVANAPNGLYALIDYVNFKGEGINPNERYRGEGWGLLQVLEGMPAPRKGESGASVMLHFRESAKKVLSRRVENADPSRNEGRWLKGWHNRCDTY